MKKIERTIINQMIDNHTHIIPNVDDGSSSIDSSIKIIEEEINQGVKEIICTPHYQKNIYTCNKENIQESFCLLKDEVKKRNLDIELYLGREIYIKYPEDINETLLNNIITMNNTNIVLIEFSYTNVTDVSEICYTLTRKGYRVMIAHIERYDYLSYDIISELKSNFNCLIQINASSIIGKNGRRSKKVCDRLLSNNMVDIIASDIHEKRINYLNTAYRFLSKKKKYTNVDNMFNYKIKNDKM